MRRPLGHRRRGGGGSASTRGLRRDDIAIGGAVLAAQAAAFGLIDEYRVWIYHVLVGGGIPFFPRHEPNVTLELLETCTFGSKVISLCYTVTR